MEINADGFAAEGFAGKSANQLYKESGSTVPFKDWLTDMQKQGYLNETGGGGTGKEKEKKKVDADKIVGAVGQGIGLVSEIVGLVKGGKDKKKQAAIDAQLSNIRDADLSPAPAQASAGLGGVPMGVWYGVSGVVILVAGYFIYQNFIASTGSATPQNGGAQASKAS